MFSFRICLFYMQHKVNCFRRPGTLATFVATSSAIFSFWQMWMRRLITRMLSACFPTLTFVTGLFAYINQKKKNALEVAGIFITKNMIKRAWELMRVSYMHSETITRDIIHFTLKTKRMTSALTMLSLPQASSTANLDRVTFDSHQLSSSFDPALKLERGGVFFLSTPGFIGSCKNYLWRTMFFGKYSSQDYDDYTVVVAVWTLFSSFSGSTFEGIMKD